MFCDQAKEYLSQKGLEFQERNIAQDPGALADLKKLGYMTTPVIVIDGSVIVGFDAEKIDQAVSGLLYRSREDEKTPKGRDGRSLRIAFVLIVIFFVAVVF